MLPCRKELSHLAFFVNLKLLWCSLVLYWWREEVANLTLLLQHPWYTVKWTYHLTLRQRWESVVSLMLYDQSFEEVVNLTSWFQRSNHVVNTTLYIHSIVTWAYYPKLRQRSNVSILTLWHQSVASTLCISCTTLQLCHNVLATLSTLLQRFLFAGLVLLNKSSFKRGDSCINQLLLITHEICHLLEERFEVGKVF